MSNRSRIVALVGLGMSVVCFAAGAMDRVSGAVGDPARGSVASVNQVSLDEEATLDAGDLRAAESVPPALDAGMHALAAACPSGPVTFLDPPSGTVDARQPNPVNSLEPRQGIQTIVVQAPPGADPACFTFCESHHGEEPNSIQSVAENDGTYTITLARPITPGAVTRVSYNPGTGAPTIATYAAHPGNVNGDGFAAPLDVLALIDCLNGVNLPASCPWSGYSCDIDQSGICGPADIAREVELLNGTDVYDPWNGIPLPSDTCAPPPPGMALIPAGEFVMGDHHSGTSWALPLHAVYTDAFYMDKFEVTNRQYADALNWAWSQGNLITVNSGGVYKYNSGTSYPYCTTTSSSSASRITWSGSVFGVVGQALPAGDAGNKTNHPMVEVSWYGSAAYANWRSAMEGRTPSYDTTTWACDFNAGGYRLPTEAEWEKAARGGNHSPYYRYPWGDTLDGSKANYWGSGDPFETGNYPWTTPVGYYMANGYGLYDMTGNVWEWCNDWYTGYSVCNPSPCVNPRGPASGSYRVLRGGSWISNDYNLTCAARFNGGPFFLYFHTVGFRLALNSS